MEAQVNKKVGGIRNLAIYGTRQSQGLDNSADRQVTTSVTRYVGDLERQQLGTRDVAGRWRTRDMSWSKKEREVGDSGA